MLQRCVQIAPIARIIDNNHEAYRNAPKNIKGQISFVHYFNFGF
jgi:hypothetical protein